MRSRHARTFRSHHFGREHRKLFFFFTFYELIRGKVEDNSVCLCLTVPFLKFIYSLTRFTFYNLLWCSVLATSRTSAVSSPVSASCDSQCIEVLRSSIFVSVNSYFFAMRQQEFVFTDVMKKHFFLLQNGLLGD